MGVMLINMFVYGTFEGLNGAIDTYVSQYYGAGEYYSCNLVYNRAFMINTLVYIPIAIMLSFSKTLLVYLQQPVEVAEIAEIFCYYQLFGQFFNVHFDSLKRFLQAQGVFEVCTQ